MRDAVTVTLGETAWLGVPLPVSEPELDAEELPDADVDAEPEADAEELPVPDAVDVCVGTCDPEGEGEAPCEAVGEGVALAVPPCVLVAEPEAACDDVSDGLAPSESVPVGVTACVVLGLPLGVAPVVELPDADAVVVDEALRADEQL